MKGARVLLIAMGVLIALSLWAPVQAADQVWTTPQKITSSTAWSRGGPVVYGDKVYYTERKSLSNPSEVWLWDQAGGARLYLGGPDYLAVNVWAAYQDKVLFTRYANQQYSLYLRDPLTGDRLISATAGDFSNSPMASMCGDMVTWTDVRSGVKQVYTWDPVNGERHLNPTSYDQKNPKVYGGKVVYEDYRYMGYPGYQGESLPPDIWSWDVQNGNLCIGAGMSSPVIYQDRIYASDRGWLTQLTPISTHLATGTGVSIPTGVWGDVVAMWTGYSWDPVHGTAKINDNWGSAPTLQGRTAVWAYQNDIYVATSVPEPSALCSLGMLLAGACVTLRRRRRA